MTRRTYERIMPILIGAGILFMVVYALVRPFLG